jgi:uncharacterized protein GlcG (DUF336 family)
LETDNLVYAGYARNSHNPEEQVQPISAKLGALLVAVALATASGSAQLADKKALTLAAAKQVAAEAEAAKNNFSMVIAIVDDGGNLIYLEHMDEAQLASIKIAEEKAHTALSFKRPTKALEDAVTSGRTNMMTIPNTVMVEGGIPLVADGKIIGAIGVSGGNSSQDGGVAKAGAEFFAKMAAH